MEQRIRIDPAEVPWTGRLLIGLLLAAYMVAIVRVVAGDTLAAYTVKFPDSYDWLANGLYWAGCPLESGGRPPLNPLVYAGLFRIGAPNAIPYLGPLYLLLTVALLLGLGTRVVGPAAVYAAALYATNAFVLGHALVIGSDVLAIGLELWGLLELCAFTAEGRRRHLYRAAVACALATLAQRTLPLLVPAYLCALLWQPSGADGPLRRLRDLSRDPHVWLALAVASLPGLVAAWTLPRSAVPHESLLRPQLDSLRYYAWATLGAWSLPTTLLAVAGAVTGLRDVRRRRVTSVLLVCASTAAGLFVLFYTWRDDRFILYATLPALLLAGIALARLPLGLAVPACLLAMAYGNLSVTPAPSPMRPAIVLGPRRAIAVDYFTQALVPADDRPRFYRRTLERWVRVRRTRMHNVRRDDPYYNADREVFAARVPLHAAAGEVVYYDPAPGPMIEAYMIRNQFALEACRRVVFGSLEALRRASPAPSSAGTAVIVRRERLAELGAADPAGFQLLEERNRYALIRLLGGSATGTSVPP